jgi:hypothetical protein
VHGLGRRLRPGGRSGQQSNHWSKQQDIPHGQLLARCVQEVADQHDEKTDWVWALLVSARRNSRPGFSAHGQAEVHRRCDASEIEVLIDQDIDVSGRKLLAGSKLAIHVDGSIRPDPGA